MLETEVHAMVECGEQERPSEDPRSRFARLSAEIDKARRQFAALRHEGERHYIDDQPVDAEVPAVLRDIVAQSDELAALQSMSTGTTDVNRALPRDSDQHAQPAGGRRPPPPRAALHRRLTPSPGCSG
jgi:hypothetical protein